MQNRDSMERIKQSATADKMTYDFQKGYAEILSKNLLDNDVRKANELVETLLLIQIHVTNDKGEYVTTVNAVVGIKAKMHPIDSMDIIERVKNKNKDRNFFMKLIQTTTAEISFFKDFVFAVDRAKLDALSISKKNQTSSTIWKVLERRSMRSKFKRLAGIRNNAMAISTLVMSQPEVEYLKRESGINLDDPSVGRGIMEAYNLMCLCIVDEALEVTKFLFDTGQDLYESLSFSALERESTDNSYKRIVNLIAKGGTV